VPTLQELSYFWMADFTAATLAWSDRVGRDCDEGLTALRVSPRSVRSSRGT